MFGELQLVGARDKLKFVVHGLFQTFDQDRVVNPFAANEDEASPVLRDRKVRDLFVAQIADEVRILVIERLPPERIPGTVGGEVVETLVVGGPGAGPGNV